MRAKAKMGMEMAGEVMERGIDIAGRRNNLRSSYHLRAIEVMRGRKGGDEERISIDGITSPNMDTSSNSRILNWTDWADYIRGEGHVVDMLTEGPISTEKLVGYDVLIIAEPDVTTSGPAYYTTEENDAIKSFVENGVGYFIHMTSADTWTYTGSAYTDMNISLQQGLNMIGWLNCSKPIDDALSSIDGDYWYVARWNATAQSKVKKRYNF